MKYFNMKFIVILVLLTYSNISYASVVGLLSTHKETYPHELGFSYNIIEMLDSLGATPIMIDYNQLVKDGDDLEKSVRTFIKENKITHVIIPGNYYNLDAPPYAPNTNRQDATAIISRIADEGTIYLMGICGGLQGIMYSKGIEIVKVENINGNLKKHLISNATHPHSAGTPLHKVRINPVSRVAKILEKTDVNRDKNGWIYLYLPDAHSRVLNNSKENIQKISAAGYKIVGFSDDGMIEIVEDKFGNIHFQDHPEGLVINLIKDKTISSLRDESADATLEIFKDFIK